jgi:hypothetical protein
LLPPYDPLEPSPPDDQPEDDCDEELDGADPWSVLDEPHEDEPDEEEPDEDEPHEDEPSCLCDVDAWPEPASAGGACRVRPDGPVSGAGA